MLISLVLLVLIILTSLFCVGLVGLSQNIRLSVRIYFSLGIIFLNGWIVLLYLSNLSTPWVLFFNRAVYASPIVGLFFLGQFVDDNFNNVPSRRVSPLGLLSLIVSLPVALIALTNLNVSGLVPRTTSGQITGYSIIPGQLSLVVAVATFVLSGTVLLRLIAAYRVASKDAKRSLRVILQTLSAAFITSLGANILFPLLFGGSDLANAISSLAATVFIVSLAYSVLRYSFLDVRLLVVRSVAYVAGLALLLLFVVFSQTALLNFLGFNNQLLDAKQRATLVVLFLFAAVIFNPLQKLFSKVTSRLFFKSGYDSNKFIATFNSGLVRHISIRELLSESMAEIEAALKPAFCAAYIRPTRSTPEYIVGTGHLNAKDGLTLFEAAGSSADQVLVVPGSSDRRIEDQFGKTARKYDVEVLAKLLESGGDHSTMTGYIVLGPKRNGEVFNKTDIELIGIVANELELAVQNALRFEEIQRFNLTLQEEVDDATRKLRRQNRRLEELDNIKDDFISMASHQLRTPLTSVKGYISMVLEGDAGKLNDTQTQMLKQAFASSQRMVFLITDLLNVSRLKTGKFVIDAAPTKLNEVVGQELEQLHETAQVKNVELSFEKPKSFPELMLDEVKTRQVIMNFVDNAIYYTPSGGHIRVELIDKPATVEFRVIDDGIGVPKSEQHHLFTKFYRATNARKARPDGTGLGLFMAQKVILAQGGSVIFNSEENKGSTFGFSLSKARLVAPANGAAQPAKTLQGAMLPAEGRKTSASLTNAH